MQLPLQRTIIAGLALPFLFLFFLSSSQFVSSLNIAFVCDTDIDGDESSPGYGHRSFDLIVDQEVDLVVHVGDFEYWGRCAEAFSISTLPPLSDGIDQDDVSNLNYFLTSMDGEKYALTTSTIIRRYAHHDGKHGCQKGWQIEVTSPDDNVIQSNHDKPSKFVISDKDWDAAEKLYNLQLLPGPRECYREPRDAPWVWHQFFRDCVDDGIDFLGYSGKAEVKEEPLDGSAEIWKDHQRHMCELYQERIVQNGCGKCRGYEDPSFPGAVEEYGECFSCLCGDDNQHHIHFFGWWQRSDERGHQNTIDECAKSVDFIVATKTPQEHIEAMPWSRRENEEIDGETSSYEVMNVEDGLVFPRPGGLQKCSSPNSSNNKKIRQEIRKPRTLDISTPNHAKNVSIVVRPMNMADIADVYHVGNSIFTASYFPTLFRTWDASTAVQYFDSAPEFCFVAEAIRHPETDDEDENSETLTDGVTKTSSTTDAEVIGFLLGNSLTKRTCGTQGYIKWVAVHPSFRRQGIAKSLLAAYIDSAKNQNISLLIADTPADNHQAIQMLAGVGLSQRMDHVYLTCRLDLNRIGQQHVNEDGSFSFSYTARGKNFIVRNMEVEDLHPVYSIGERVFTKEFSNIYPFWNEHTVMSSYLSDEFCVVATVRDEESSTERVVGFAFGSSMEKPQSSWKYGWLVWLGCDPDFQRVGLATQLYNTMAELFALDNVTMILVDTQASNEGALAFFRKQGFGQDEEFVYLSNTT